MLSVILQQPRCSAFELLWVCARCPITEEFLFGRTRVIDVMIHVRMG